MEKKLGTKFYVKVDIEAYYDEEEEYLSVDADNFDIDVNGAIHWNEECRKWICYFLDEHYMISFTSYRFVFYLKNEYGDCLEHMQYDIPWYIMRLFDVFKSEICETCRAQGRKEAD